MKEEITDFGSPVDNSTLVKREMTFGEKLVGITFNPAKDDKVAKAKQLCADLADLLNDENNSKESSQFSQRRKR